MATEKKRRDADLLAVTKQLAQLEKLCRALQTERTSLISQLKTKTQQPLSLAEESQLKEVGEESQLELPIHQKDHQDSSVILVFFFFVFFCFFVLENILKFLLFFFNYYFVLLQDSLIHQDQEASQDQNVPQDQQVLQDTPVLFFSPVFVST